MATREDSIFEEHAELIGLIEKQIEINMRVKQQSNTLNEIQGYLKDGPDTINKIKMSMRYDGEQHAANRKRILELLTAKPEPKSQ